MSRIKTEIDRALEHYGDQATVFRVVRRALDAWWARYPLTQSIIDTLLLADSEYWKVMHQTERRMIHHIRRLLPIDRPVITERLKDVGHDTTFRGHPIYWDGTIFRYWDNHKPVKDTWLDRPCGHCGLENTKEGHDGCLGNLPGVQNACCGHGGARIAYVQHDNGESVHGEKALIEIQRLKQAMEDR